MSRSQRRPAPPWLLRGLLVLLTLTGLGVWQGAHCVDDASADQAMSVAAVSASSATASPMPTHHHRDLHFSGLSSTTADNCAIAPAAVARTTMTATPALPAVERAAPAASASRPAPPPCFSPGVTLTRLGVSRT